MMMNNCDHANECPCSCPCKADCICRLTIGEGGTGMCHVDEVATRAKIEADPEDDTRSFMEQAMAGFSYVGWAEQKRDPKLDLNFGELDEQQSLKARRFWDLHDARHGHYAGAAGGRYSWRITGTGLGLITVTICGACKEELDVTDFESW